ncbi:MAG: carbohydrate ABC transporter permease [Caldilineaceae bacterium]|nr:carbohydrate ABC transporter permease [Caldilineaceae bacterium]
MRKKWLTPIDIVIYVALGIFAFMTIYPFWSLIIISFSESDAYFASQYHLIPNSFSLEAYKVNFENPQFLRSLLISIGVTIVGTTNSLFWTTIMGYFLAKKRLAFVSIIAMLFLVTLFFDGGLVPNFVLIRQLGLRNNLLAIILPFTVHPFYLILTSAYFASRNPEIEEAAVVDGAGSFTVLFRIVIPTAKPILATIGLFYAVQYWNDWFCHDLPLRPGSLSAGAFLAQRGFDFGQRHHRSRRGRQLQPGHHPGRDHRHGHHADHSGLSVYPAILCPRHHVGFDQGVANTPKQ